MKMFFTGLKLKILQRDIKLKMCRDTWGVESFTQLIILKMGQLKLIIHFNK